MRLGEMLFLVVSFGAITLFGCVLAWASWKERSHAKRQEQERAAAPAHPIPSNVTPLGVRQPV